MPALPSGKKKQQPFYRQVVCIKAQGGKHSHWSAYLREQYLEACVGGPSCSPTGSGNTADNAIKDLAVQLRAKAANGNWKQR
jgi:hypothetical protein